MKDFLRSLITFTILILITGTWFALTWYKVIPNWFNIEFFNDWLKIDWWESVTHPKLILNSSNSNCWDEYWYNKRILNCKSKCETIEWYWESIFIQRYTEKYWEKPQKNCYKSTISDNARKCYYYKYPEDFSYNYTWYDEWIHEIFSLDIEKIKEYNECIRGCWPMVEPPMCLQ